MSNRTNGKHDRTTRSAAAPRFDLPNNAEADSTEAFGAKLAKAHEVLIRRSSDFIRQRPGVSLVAAAFLGVAIGWIVKRRS